MAEGMRFAVVGHPLAAPENRLPFERLECARVDLVVPSRWKARSAGRIYDCSAPAQSGPGASAVARGMLHSLPVRFSGRNSLFLWKGLCPLLDALQPRLVYAWEEAWCLSAWQVLRWAQRRGIPFWFYAAENRPKRLPPPFGAASRRLLAAAQAAVSVTSQSEAILREMGFKGPIHRIPLSVRPFPMLRPSPGSRTVAYVGRLVPIKRVDLLVRALAYLPDCRLRIIGDGPEGGSLRRLARGLGVLSRMEMPGPVPNENLPEALDGCALLCLPTGETPRQAEQFGKAALEAMVCGLPVLASRTGHLAALAREIPALRCESFAGADELAAHISHRLANPPAPGVLADSRRKVLAGFGPRAVAEAFASALDLQFAGISHA